MSRVPRLRRSGLQWRRDLRWGMLCGLGYGIVFSGFVLITHGAPSAQIGVPLSRIVFFYLVGGIVGGLIVGSLRPLTTTLLGWMVTGVIITFPIVVLAYRLDPSLAANATWTEQIECAVLLGICYGVAFWLVDRWQP